MKKAWLTPEMRMAQYAVNETVAAGVSSLWENDTEGDGAKFDLSLG